MREEQILFIYQLRDRYDVDPSHSEQVKKLSIKLFNHLEPVHNLGDSSKDFLIAAALLHDIGYATGNNKNHHLYTASIILKNGITGFTRKEISIIAYVACLHKRNVPPDFCIEFKSLSAEDKLLVLRLASILRIANGLDKTHRSSIRDLTCDIKTTTITVYLRSDFSIDEELILAYKNSELFCYLFKREIEFLPVR
ncbi:MAG: HD domain-containing protein [Candidatus Marinimicrobia bacterium]|nr:HD domain-containing protein [Candidatus Neomarinimicrobiota bacterium]